MKNPVIPDDPDPTKFTTVLGKKWPRPNSPCGSSVSKPKTKPAPKRWRKKIKRSSSYWWSNIYELERHIQTMFFWLISIRISINPNLSIVVFQMGMGQKKLLGSSTKKTDWQNQLWFQVETQIPFKVLFLVTRIVLSAPNGTQHRFHQRWGFGKGFHLASNGLDEVTWCYAATQHMVFNMFVWVNHTQSTKGKWAWSFNKFCGLSSVFGLCWLVWWRTPPFSSWQNDVGLATLQTTNLPTPSTLERKIFKAIITKNNDIIIGVLFQPILVES